MEGKLASCNFTKYIKRGPNRWQHCPVVRGKTGRVKQDLVLVDGRVEHHLEGYYSLDCQAVRVFPSGLARNVNVYIGVPTK